MSIGFAPEMGPHALAGRIFGVGLLSRTRGSRRLAPEVLGERRIETVLATLGPDWTVLPSIRVGEHGRVVDHLAIGPSGVFTIEVARGKGSEVVAHDTHLVVDGIERPFLDSARDEAADAAVNLTHVAGFNIPARGLLVFIRPRSITVHDEPYDVAVTSDRALRARLDDAPRVLDARGVAAIAYAATALRRGPRL